MQFEKYMHLERFGTDAVDGINIGECHIFPKLDGTNSQVWLGDDGSVCCGSRNRVLSIDDDNAGFMAWVMQHQGICEMVEENPTLRFFGEWLVPHSLKTYQDDAWRNFYVFDVYTEDGAVLTYDQYIPICKKYGVAFVPCLTKSRNPSYEVLTKATEANKYLIKDGNGVGEGIVIKQYGFQNKFGKTVWAKLVTNSFRDKHITEMGGTVVNLKIVEESIAEVFVTAHMVEKIIAKIRTDKGEFAAKSIPQLLGMAYHDLVTEELWEAIKTHKNPRIDFSTLHHCVIARVKSLKPEIFGVKVSK
jgi:hypothetical protein